MDISEEVNKLTYRVIGCCMKVHTILGPGFPEDYYQRALEYEFKDQDIPFEPQKLVQVFYREYLVGQNYLDFVVADTIVLEIKSTRQLDDVHRAQVLKYLTATNYQVALIVNFGQASLVQERLLLPKKVQNFRNTKQQI